MLNDVQGRTGPAIEMNETVDLIVGDDYCCF